MAPGQFELALEDLETAMVVVHAEEDAEDRAAKRPVKPRAANRGSLPKHPPRPSRCCRTRAADPDAIGQVLGGHPALHPSDPDQLAQNRQGLTRLAGGTSLALFGGVQQVCSV
jgi:hypothetical protein